MNVENHDNKIDHDDDDEIKRWKETVNYNFNKTKRSENSTHVTGKNSCIETEFKREMKRYYVGLKQNLDKIDRIQEETAIKMYRLYKESRKLARRSRNERRQSLMFYRKHSSKVKRREEEEDDEQQRQEQQEQEQKNEASLHDLIDETDFLEAELMKPSTVLSPLLPVIHQNKIVSLTSNQNDSTNIIEEVEAKEDQINAEVVKPNISSWLETISEEKDNINEQESCQPLKLDALHCIQHHLQKKYSTIENSQTRQSINYSVIKHKENRLCNLKAALSEAPIAYLWKDNLNKNTTKLKTKLIFSKFKDFNLQAKRCLPGSVGGLSSYFLEIIALPKPALIRFPPPTSMHQYMRKKMLITEKQQMQQNLIRLSNLTEEMKNFLEGQKLMAVLKFLLATTKNDKNEANESE
ncbi:unnamed protein product [Schistosoma turkestanicum]|nr:unnamed protein product [Schistosoma turkestanicum]